MKRRSMESITRAHYYAQGIVGGDVGGVRKRGKGGQKTPPPNVQHIATSPGVSRGRIKGAKVH